MASETRQIRNSDAENVVISTILRSLNRHKTYAYATRYMKFRTLIKRVPFEEYINRATEVWFAFLTIRQYIKKRAYLC